MSPNTGILLTYWRDGKAETFSGTVDVDSADYHRAFSELDFRGLLFEAQRALLLFGSQRLVFQRKEAPYPMVLPTGLEELLIKNLDAAYQALSPEPREVIVGRSRPSREGALRHGHDTLAEAFGDVVYFRARTGKNNTTWAEDPLSGRWGVVEKEGQGWRLRQLLIESVLFEQRFQWVTALTKDLLALGAPRYYLPRRWNPSGGWISHADLTAFYDSYQKEKLDVYRSQ
jgi:hypothetical protein